MYTYAYVGTYIYVCYVLRDPAEGRLLRVTLNTWMYCDARYAGWHVTLHVCIGMHTYGYVTTDVMSLRDPVQGRVLRGTLK